MIRCLNLIGLRHGHTLVGTELGSGARAAHERTMTCRRRDAHTERISARWKKWVPYLSALLFSAVAGSNLAHAQPGSDPLPVRVALVRPQVIHNDRAFVGTVTPIRQAVIGTAVEGRVQDVFIEQGSVIRPEAALSAGEVDSDLGVPLVQLRTATIDIELAAARSELELRLAMQQELQESVPADLELAQATLGAATARFQFAKSEWERAQDLASKGTAFSRSEMDQRLSAFEAATQDEAAARAAFKKLEKTQYARLAQLASQVNNQREAIRLLEDRRGKYTVRAPFEGVVTRRPAEIGQWLTTGAEVAEVVQMNPIEVVIMVPQGMLSEFQYSMNEQASDTEKPSRDATASSGPSATITIDNDATPLTGRVHALVPTADLMSRSFPVKIRLDNPKTNLGYRLNPGMLVKVNIRVGQVQQSLMVHKDALVLNNSGKSVVVIDRSVEPNIAKSVPVVVGSAVADYVSVTGELKDKDWVVIEGNERLRTGNPVKVINANTLDQTPTATASSTATEMAGATN
ncbi:MAG: efflux RND transporter periplasmic adaptor subunit [Planctomycetaceae bacterium]|nr:efflux RND transporter periplasmic adaptor subunit [Planctomycetaceae bacterium]